jgi:multiple sugar transport system permease protein
MKKITVTKKTTAKVVGGLAKYIVLIFIFAFLLFPVYWMLVTALKTNIESYRLVPTLWPETISLDGFKTLISDGKFLVYYKNNIIVSAMAAVIICFISVFAGYALSRFHFKWNKMLLAISCTLYPCKSNFIISRSVAVSFEILFMKKSRLFSLC